MKAIAAVTTIIRVAMNQLLVSRSVNEESPAVPTFSSPNVHQKPTALSRLSSTSVVTSAIARECPDTFRPEAASES
jgi:hypothetical protein